jgi:hypothetical protein
VETNGENSETSRVGKSEIEEKDDWETEEEGDLEVGEDADEKLDEKWKMRWTMRWRTRRKTRRMRTIHVRLCRVTLVRFEAC